MAEGVRTGWIGRPPDREERAEATLIAAAVGVAAGLGAYYLARLFLFRDEVALDPPSREDEGEK